MLREYVKPFAGVISVEMNEDIATSIQRSGRSYDFVSSDSAGGCYEYVTTYAINATAETAASELNRCITELLPYLTLYVDDLRKGIIDSAYAQGYDNYIAIENCAMS